MVDALAIIALPELHFHRGLAHHQSQRVSVDNRYQHIVRSSVQNLPHNAKLVLFSQSFLVPFPQLVSDKAVEVLSGVDCLAIG